MAALQFGVFLTPRAADPGRLRDNAQAAEAAGFDFISVQDRPHQQARNLLMGLGDADYTSWA